MRGLPFALLVLLAVCAAAIDVQPKEVGSALVSVDLVWQIRFGSQLPTEAAFTTFGFPVLAGQQVDSFASDSAYLNKSDGFGNALLEFSFQPAGNEKIIHLEARVRTSSESGRERASGDLSKYLQASPFVPLDADLRAKSFELTRGINNDFEKTVLLTEWVHNYVEYDGPGFGSSVQDASSVYQNKRGTCDEFTHLLLALLRSAGIPSRFVAGLVYSGEEWGMHAWAEAAVNGEWIPLDPTYGEAGRIDATHILFSRGLDQDDIKSEISGRASGISGFTFAGTEITPVPTVQLLEAGNFTANRFSLSLETTNKTVGGGSLENVTIVVSAAREPMGVPLSLSTPPELQVLDSEDRLVFLSPGEEKRVTWRVLVPSDLRENYIYQYPLNVQSLGVEKTVLLEARKGGARSEGEGFVVQGLFPEVSGDELHVRVVVGNAGNQEINATAILSLAGQEVSRPFFLPIGGSVQLEFTVPAPPGVAQVEGELVLNGAEASLRQPITIFFPTPTPSATPLPSVVVSVPGGEVQIPSFSEEQLVVYGAVALVVFALVGLALAGRRRG